MQALDFPLRISRGTILRKKQAPLNKKKKLIKMAVNIILLRSRSSKLVNERCLYRFMQFKI